MGPDGVSGRQSTLKILCVCARLLYLKNTRINFDFCIFQSNELNLIKKENDKLREEVNSKDIKIKWIQNKLKTEIEMHKVGLILHNI